MEYQGDVGGAEKFQEGLEEVTLSLEAATKSRNDSFEAAISMLSQKLGINLL